MTTTQTIEDILRPLAERRIQCPCSCHGPSLGPCGEHIGSGHTGSCSPPCGPGGIPDPRFEALRCKHNRAHSDFVDGHTICSDCGYESLGDEGGIDASLGAIVEAARASGLYRVIFYMGEDDNSGVGCEMVPSLARKGLGDGGAYEVGETLEEAAAIALRAAVEAQ